MLNIEYHSNLDEKYYKIIDMEFNKFAKINLSVNKFLNKRRVSVKVIKENNINEK